IDGDEIGVDVLALVAELVQPAVELEQRRRADLGAVGEAEEHDRGLAAKRLLGDFGIALIDQRERLAEGLARILPAIPVEGQVADRGYHQHDDPDQYGAHHVSYRMDCVLEGWSWPVV